jgi:biofilm protein TabA
MILDRLENAAAYEGLAPRIAAALRYLQGTDFAALADGRYELDGDRLFAIVQRYQTKPSADAAWEAHRRYIDVQYVVEGAERIGYAALRDGLRAAKPYDAEKDVAFFDARGDLFELAVGSFAIFGPQDVHAPGLAAGRPEAPGGVLKVVVKCRKDES